MELLIRDGDYVPDGRGGLRRAQGTEELLQRVLFKLSARRGSFPLLPELGSRLYLLTREKPSAWAGMARQYAAEALQGEELTVAGVSAVPREGGIELTVELEYRGESLSLTLEV